MSFLEKAKEALGSAAKAAKEAAENAPSKAQEAMDFIKQNMPKTDVCWKNCMKRFGKLVMLFGVYHLKEST